MDRYILFLEDKSAIYRKGDSLVYLKNTPYNYYFSQKILNQLEGTYIPLYLSFKELKEFRNDLKLGSGEYQLLRMVPELEVIFLYPVWEEIVYNLEKNFYLFKHREKKNLHIYFIYRASTENIFFLKNLLEKLSSVYKVSFYLFPEGGLLEREEWQFKLLRKCYKTSEKIFIISNVLEVYPLFFDFPLLFLDRGYSQITDSMDEVRYKRLEESRKVFFLNFEEGDFSLVKGNFKHVFNIFFPENFSNLMWLQLYQSENEFSSLERFAFYLGGWWQKLVPNRFQKSS